MTAPLDPSATAPPGEAQPRRGRRDLLVGAFAGGVALAAAEAAAGVTPVSPQYPVGHAWRYLSDRQIADVQAGTQREDCTAGLQSWIAACETNAYGAGAEAYLPAGVYRRTATLRFTKQFIRLRGDGAGHSTIQSAGVAGPVFAVTPPPSGLWCPTISDLSLIADASSGHGFDLSALTASAQQCYNFEFRNLLTITGGAAIYALNCFNGAFQNWFARSLNDHTFRVACGPGVNWINTYASQCAPGKAGYRLAGIINMMGANGLDQGDYWGIFGQNWAGTDGYQNDFPSISGTPRPNDFPAVTLFGCNVEEFASLSATASGIMLENAYRCFEFIGGKIDRGSLATPYFAMIRVKAAPFAPGGVIRLAPAQLFSGGTPGAGQLLYADAQAIFEDLTGFFGPYYASGLYRGNVPVLRMGATADVPQDTALALSAVSAQRTTLGMVRYATTALAPSGPNQSINVTGHTKVVVTPPVPGTSLSTATFTTTPGAGLDAGRNGDLLIEAGNGNLVLNHSAGGPFTFYLAGGTALACRPGGVYRFCFSSTNGNWVQV